MPGNFHSFCNTEELVIKLQQSNTNMVDQRAYVKQGCSICLLAIDRHEGNWSWGEVKVTGGTLYKPRPAIVINHSSIMTELLIM